VLAVADVKAKLEALRMEIRSGAGDEMRAVLAGDMVKWGRRVKEKNIQIAQWGPAAGVIDWHKSRRINGLSPTVPWSLRAGAGAVAQGARPIRKAS
jgi:hypothetical protein